MKIRIIVSVALFSALQFASPVSAGIDLTPIGRFATGVFDEGAAEIVAYDPASRRMFVSNGADGAVDVVDIQDPTSPQRLFQLDVSAYGEAPTHVAIRDGIVAVSVPAVPKTDPGHVLFFDASGGFLKAVRVGALPDMLTFTPDGRYVLTANEGEPSSYCSDGVDPEGSISIIKMPKKISHLSDRDVRTADFHRFNRFHLPGIRIYGPHATVSQDLEPEYLTVSEDSRVAWVTLQENNALAIIDIRHAFVLALLPLGVKDHSAPHNGLDASDRDDAINIAQWPVRGLYEPDGIASYVAGTPDRGKSPLSNLLRTFLVTANEGDAREYYCLLEQNQTEAELRAAGEDPEAEDARIKDLELDPVAFPDADVLQENENLGRLGVTVFDGNSDGQPGYERLFSLGGRSFSIRNAAGQLVWDSGDDIEQITSQLLPDDFNSNNDENDSFDNRSDNKGPEPEGVAVGEVDGRIYAFIGLERIGGVMVYDVSKPYDPSFVQYVNTRNFDPGLEDDALATTDLGPEGLLFVPEADSPSGKPLLLVAHEVSGSTVIFEINRD